MYWSSMCGDGTLELLMLARLFLVVPIPQVWADARVVVVVVVRTVCIIVYMYYIDGRSYGV